MWREAGKLQSGLQVVPGGPKELIATSGRRVDVVFGQVHQLARVIRVAVEGGSADQNVVAVLAELGGSFGVPRNVEERDDVSAARFSGGQSSGWMIGNSRFLAGSMTLLLRDGRIGWVF